MSRCSWGCPLERGQGEQEPGSPSVTTAEGGHRESPWRLESGLPVMVPEHCSANGISSVPGGEIPLCQGNPYWATS